MIKASTLKEAMTEARFKEWLNAQPDTRKFDYYHNSACLVSSFVRETSTVAEPISAGGFEVSCAYGTDKQETFKFHTIPFINAVGRAASLSPDSHIGYRGVFSLATFKIYLRDTLTWD
jgi:hypothetical protein